MEMVRDRGDTFHSFYRTFLLRLFHDGLGKPDGSQTREAGTNCGT